VVDKVEDVTAGELVEQFLGQVYGEDAVAAPAAGTAPGGNGHGDGEPGQAPRGSIPREVLVPVLPPAATAVEEWLCRRRGSRVSLRVPRRGDKKALLETVARNAGESLAQHKMRRASDLTTRSRALHEIQEALGLDQAPLRIECYDVSNLQGTNVVASAVVFEDGLARKSEYRRFSIRGTGGEGDVASIHEVITRRFRRYLEERESTGELDTLGDPAGQFAARDPAGPASGDPAAGRPGPLDEDGRPRKFAYPPNLVVVDGGPAQVEAAVRALDELGIDDIAVCGLAKRLEEVWLPGEDAPVILPRSSEGLYLLQRVRDEAHRFAITYHRAKRSKAMAMSELDAVPGLGPARRATLLRHFGSVRKIASATEGEIAEVPGIGPRLASAVLAALSPGRGQEHPRDRGAS
jgi:excinuclease ABC subunit C